MRVKYYEDNLNHDRMNREKILELLKNKDTRLKVLSILTQTNDPKILENIIKRFDDEDVKIRGEVFSALFLNENNILKELISGLNHESKNVRAYVMLVLANRNEKEAIEDIKKLTNDPSGLVRTCAYGALGHLEVKNCAKELHKGIFDSNKEAVKSASYALAKIGEEILQEEIEHLDEFNDPDFNKILKFFN